MLHFIAVEQYLLLRQQYWALLYKPDIVLGFYR